MLIQLYDRVILKDGNPASIVEVFDDGVYLADIDRDGDTFTEDITTDDIDRNALLFSMAQIVFMQKIGIDIAASTNVNHYDLFDIEDKVSTYLLKNGFDERYEPTEEGRMCESILDML